MYINFYSIFIFLIIYGLGLEPRFSSVLCCLSSGSQFDCLTVFLIHVHDPGGVELQP